MRRGVVLLSIGSIFLLACSDSSPSKDRGTPLDRGGDADGSGPIDLGPGPGEAAPPGEAGLPDHGPVPKTDAGVPGLPFPYTRPAVGVPVTAAELSAITDKYLDLLTKTRYFDVVDERVHGWPQSDPKGGYWYGTWWSGCGLTKTGGKVTFEHVNVGADNNGIATSAVMEGVCLAHKLWPGPKLEQLTRRLIRGFNSWVLAMERMPADPNGTLLARTSYPPPILSTDGGRTAFIDYSTNRPGLDSYCQYVNIPANPYWGDIWIKNNRSKDDIGHMLRAIATLNDCAPALSPATNTDRQAMQASYVKWAQRVEADGWAIATYDKSGKMVLPPLDSTMSRFILLGNAECNAVLSLKLFSQGLPGSFACGNGIHPLEFLAMNNDHNAEILRSFHEAAVKQALLAKQNTIAQAMLPGLGTRLDEALKLAESGKLPIWLTAEQLFALIVHSAGTGVPLTWREVRWLHKQIEAAHASYLSLIPSGVYKVFDPATPDGAYEFTPSGTGISFKDLALLIGTCVATYRNPTSNPVLDCARLKAWTP